MKRRTAHVVTYDDPDPDDCGIRDTLTGYFLDNYTFDQPGVREAIFEVAKMRSYGIEITEAIVDKVVIDCAERDARRAALTAAHNAKTGNHDPLVYYIQNGSLVKIGTTINLRNRVATLALRMEQVKATEPGGLDVERRRHQQFADHRSHGEWFHLGADIQAHIDALAQAAA